MGRNPTSGSIAATGQTVLPLPVSDRVCSYLIHFNSAAFSGSVTIKGGVDDKNYALSALAYKNMATGENATDAITGSGLVLVDASGCNVVLDCTAYVSGGLSFTAMPRVG
jgi:hypothetical protein